MAKAQGAKAAAKKRVVKVDSYGDAHVTASFNNIIISLTNKQGQVISWSSAGKMGFKGSKKNTPYAAQMAGADAAKVAVDAGLKRVDVFVKGPGSGREGAIRSLSQNQPRDLDDQGCNSIASQWLQASEEKKSIRIRDLSGMIRG